MKAHAGFVSVGMRPAQQRHRLVAHRSTGMSRGVVAAILPDHLVREALQRMGVTGLQGLDSAAAFALQAPGQTGTRQAPVIGVQVHRRQRCALQRARSARRFGREIGATGSGSAAPGDLPSGPVRVLETE